MYCSNIVQRGEKHHLNNQPNVKSDALTKWQIICKKSVKVYSVSKCNTAHGLITPCDGWMRWEMSGEEALACAMKRSKSYTWLAGLLRREREQRDVVGASAGATDADDAPWVRAHLTAVDR